MFEVLATLGKKIIGDDEEEKKENTVPSKSVHYPQIQNKELKNEGFRTGFEKVALKHTEFYVEKIELPIALFVDARRVYRELGQFEYKDEEFPERIIESVEENENGVACVFVGQINVRGKRSGVGICVWKSGCIYEGYWKNWNKHGEGRFIWSCGDYYIGNWNFDNMEGYGEYYWTQGHVYKGNYKDGKRHGQGLMIYDGGAVQNGKWWKDKFLDPELKEHRKEQRRKRREERIQKEKDKEREFTIEIEKIMNFDKSELKTSKLLNKILKEAKVFDKDCHFKLIDLLIQKLRDLGKPDTSDYLTDDTSMSLRETITDFLYRFKDKHLFSNSYMKGPMDVFDIVMGFLLPFGLLPSADLLEKYSKSKVTKKLNTLPSRKYLNSKFNKYSQMSEEVYNRLKERYQSKPSFVYFFNSDIEIITKTYFSKCICIGYFEKGTVRENC